MLEENASNLKGFHIKNSSPKTRKGHYKNAQYENKSISVEEGSEYK
jgi:hypothetical protein